MPSEYDNLGIHFLYPDNWSLDEEDVPDARSVTVQSPGGAFWSIALHAPSAEPRELARTALEALKSEYPEFDAEPASEEIAGQEIHGFDFRFFYLDFANFAKIRSFRTAGASCLVLCQAEDREFEVLGAVFQAITTSLLTSEA